MKKLKLSIVIPCYNEEKNIPIILKRFSKELKKSKMLQTTEVILVDNNSNDNTKTVLKKQLSKYKFARSTFQPNPGYGAALSKGLNEASGEFVAWTHGDIQTPPADVLKAYDLIQKQEDQKKVYVKGKRIGRPLVDKLVNTLGMSIFETLVLRKPLYDINAQPNLFHRSFLKKAKNLPQEFSFDLYMYYMARRARLKIVRFPVHFGKRIFGESSWNTGWKARIKFIRRTISFTFKMKKKLRG
jgi:polyisoprenyl-phosphate glycosyltransferase